MIHINRIARIVCYMILAWVAYRCYLYFFDYTKPSITIHGLYDDGWYADDIACTLSVNKSGYVSLEVDGELLVHNLFLPEDQTVYNCIIPIQNMSNGQHVCVITCADNTYNGNMGLKKIRFYVDSDPLQAILLNDRQLQVAQGTSLHVRFQTNKALERAKVNAFAASYECCPVANQEYIYECYIPVSLEEKPHEYLFSVEMKDHVGNKIVLDNKFEIVACHAPHYTHIQVS